MTQFILNDGFCQPPDCRTHLRVVDFITGNSKVVYNSPALVLAYTDPFFNYLFIKDPTVESTAPETAEPSSSVATAQSPERQLGLFLIDLETHALQPIIEGEVPTPVWNEEVDSYFFFQRDKNPPYTEHVFWLNPDPHKGYTFEEWPDKTRNYSSPDGRYWIDQSGQEWFIRGCNCSPDQKVYGDGEWAPNSKAYVEIVRQEELGEWWLMIYLEQRGWQPLLARRISTGAYWNWIWVGP